MVMKRLICPASFRTVLRRGVLCAAACLALMLGTLLTTRTLVAHAAIVPGVGFVQIQSSPLTITVGQDTTLMAVDNRVASGPFAGEFFDRCSNLTGAFTPMVAIGTISYGPNPSAPYHCDNSLGADGENPNVFWTPVSQTFSGSGTGADPFLVVTTVQLTPTVTLTQKIRYIAGDQRFQQTLLLHSTAGTLSAKIYTPAEQDPGAHQLGFGFRDPASGAVGGSNALTASGSTTECTFGTLPSGPQYYVLLRPITTVSHFIVAPVFDTPFIIANASLNYPDTVSTTCSDLSSGLEWDRTGSSIEASESVTFGPVNP